jgi:hypothetical protein
LVAFLATNFLAGCHNEPALPAKPPIAVRLADVILYQSNEGLQYSASLIPYAQVDVAFRTTGYVTDVKQVKSVDGRTRNIGTGDYVTKGTVLAQIRRQDLKNQADESGAQVDSAIAQHAQAEQDFNRAKALYATQSLTKPEYDQAQARFDSTRAAVNQAQAAQRQAQLSLNDSQLAGVAELHSFYHRGYERGESDFRCARGCAESCPPGASAYAPAPEWRGSIFRSRNKYFSQRRCAKPRFRHRSHTAEPQEHFKARHDCVR